MGGSRRSGAAAPKAFREVSIWVENLTEHEFELLSTYAKEGEPQMFLPSRFIRSAHLRWRCGPAGCAFAVAYASLPASGSAAASDCSDELGLPPMNLSVGAVFEAEAATSSAASWMRSVVGAAPKPPPEPCFSVSLQSSSAAGAGRAPSAQLGRLLAGAAPVGKGVGQADGCEWLVSRSRRDEGAREVNTLEVRLKLLPTAGSAAKAEIVVVESEQAPEESLDEELLRRLDAWRRMAASLDSEAAELERMSSTSPLDPAKLRDLPDMARIDLTLALMMTLLHHRREVLRRHRLVRPDPSEAPTDDEPRRKLAFCSGSSASRVSDKLQPCLAKHALAVYRSLVNLVGFDQAQTAGKLSKLIKNYLPSEEGDESCIEPSDPAEFCRRLVVETARSSDNAVADSAREACWAEKDVRPLCQEGEEAFFVGKVWLLDPEVVTSVRAAVRGLNLGILPCPGSYATVFSKGEGEYYLLQRPSSQWTAQDELTRAISDVIPDGSPESRLPSFEAENVEVDSQTATAGPAFRRSMTFATAAAEGLRIDKDSQEVAPVTVIPTAAHPRPFAAGTPVPSIWLAARQLLALSIMAGDIFDARSRAALFELCGRLGVPPRLVARWENDIGGALFEARECSQVTERLKKKDRSHTHVKVAACAVGGGVLCAVTGGLAAPALAAGLSAAGAATASAGAAVGLAVPGAIVGGAVAVGGTLLVNLGAVGAAVLFGASGLGLTGFKLSRRWGQLEEFEFHPLEDKKKMLQISVDIADEAVALHLQSAINSGGGILEEDALVPCAGGGDMALQRGSQCIGIETLSVQVAPTKTVSATSLSSRRTSRSSKTEATRFRFEREVDPVQRAVHLAIFVSGWLREAEDFRRPWLHAAADFFPSSGHIAIKWETELLARLSNVFQDIMGQQAASQAASLWWKAMAFSGAGLGALVAAWPIWVIAGLASLDNIWLVVGNRASLAGECLAEVLADKHVVGQRPVTLVGHSMGARVIFSCMQKLHDMGEFNVIDDVVLLGTPVTTSQTEWEQVRAVASGRVINAYWRQDWVLAFLYRYLECKIGVAGLSPVEVEGVENIDMKGMGLKGHHDYPNHIDDILSKARIGQRRAAVGIPEPEIRSVADFLA